jgi:predicted GNAT family acetyltransferase
MTTVTDHPDRERFEIDVDGQRAGFVQYLRRGGRLIFFHTEIDPAFEGQGLGSQLATGALDAARASGEPVVPLCSFIGGWIDRHPDYDDLVDHDALRALVERPR